MLQFALGSQTLRSSSRPFCLSTMHMRAAQLLQMVIAPSTRIPFSLPPLSSLVRHNRNHFLALLPSIQPQILLEFLLDNYYSLYIFTPSHSPRKEGGFQQVASNNVHLLVNLTASPALILPSHFH